MDKPTINQQIVLDILSDSFIISSNMEAYVLTDEQKAERDRMVLEARDLHLREIERSVNGRLLQARNTVTVLNTEIRRRLGEGESENSPNISELSKKIAVEIARISELEVLSETNQKAA